MDELALLQPTAGYMRFAKDRVLYVWQQLTSEIKERAAQSERRVKAIQQTDRLDEAYLSAQTIDLTSYERQRNKLREERTFAQIDHHAEAIEEIDIQGILAFADMETLGHSQISLTLNTYSHVLPALQNAAAAEDGSDTDRPLRY